jgi:hypothetical protein
MKIEGKNYLVFYDLENNTINFQGTLRLNGLPDDKSISHFLHQIVQQNPENLTLNFYDLLFINTSGITMLSKFFIYVRSRGNLKMTLLGNKSILWQNKSLKNLQRLLPSLELVF